MIPEDVIAIAEGVLIDMGIASTPTNYDAIARAILTDREARSGWRDIASAPKDGSKFLAWHPDGYADFFHWQSHANVGWRDNFIQVYREGAGPTHWMPIPAAPSASPSPSREETEGEKEALAAEGRS